MDTPDALLAQTRFFTRFLSDEAARLLEEPWFVMANWKWLALAATIALGFVLRPVLQYLMKKARRILRGRQGSQTFWQYFLDFPQEKSLAWIIVALLWLAAIDALNLPPNLDKDLSLVVKVILAWSIVKLAYIAVDAMGRLFTSVFSKNTVAESQLVPFATKTLKVVVLILGVLISLQNFGVNVASLLAGLGLGGLAFALAAQDTVANLFGSVTILFDRPFKVGDWIKVSDIEGNVEEIGFRSTRIRTFYNSLVTMPNSVVAKEKIDNMGMRPRRRLKQAAMLSYENPPPLVKSFCDEITKFLKTEQRIDPDIYVAFGNFTKDAIEVSIVFHVRVTSGDQEVAISQWAWFGIFDIAGRLGVKFVSASPTVPGTAGVTPAPDLSAT